MPNKFEANRTPCHQFDLDLAAYLEGEARPESANHARECSACGGLLADLELIRSQVHTVLFEDPPARLWANVRATLEAEGFFGELALNCRQFDLDLAAYLEGEGRPESANHARECSACGGIIADLELIRSQADTVLFEDPPARLWANVRATLEAEGIFREATSGWLGWLPQFGVMHYAAPLAALGCLAILGAFLLVTPERVNQNVTASLPSSNQSVASGTPVNSLENTALEQTVGQMEKSYQEHAKYFDPAVQASYQKGLRSLDNSIRECRVSVQREPSDSLAREYLANAYEQKVAVLSAALEYNGR